MVAGLSVQLGVVYFIVKIYSTIMSNIADIQEYINMARNDSDF